MKKQNILDLLCDDLILEINKKQDNFNKCINDFDKCIEDNIIPYLTEQQEKFGYIFDLYSNDEIVREKSKYILSVIIKEFRELISITPDFFISLKEENDFDTACKGIIFYILMGNDIKQLFNL